MNKCPKSCGDNGCWGKHPRFCLQIVCMDSVMPVSLQFTHPRNELKIGIMYSTLIVVKILIPKGMNFTLSPHHWFISSYCQMMNYNVNLTTILLQTGSSSPPDTIKPTSSNTNSYTQCKGEPVSLGCWKDATKRAISGGIRFTSDNPIEDCQIYAASLGYDVFAVQYGGECFTSSDADTTYQKYGKSRNCQKDGRGDNWAQNVYRINKCFKGELWCDYWNCQMTSLFRNSNKFTSMYYNLAKVKVKVYRQLHQL